MSTATIAAPAQVAQQVRRARSRARRERQSLGDALYVIYVTVLVALYPLGFLAANAVPAPGPLRSAVAAAEPVLLLAVAVAVLVGRAAAAVRGGPVVVPPEDARLLLTWPVPRRSLVLPALLAAISRAVGVGLAVTAALLYVDIRDLGAPAAAVVRDDVLLPVLLALVAVLVGWLVQVTPRLAIVVRAAGLLTVLAALVALCWVGRLLAADGATVMLTHVADLGPPPGRLPFGGVADPGSSIAGALTAAGLAVVAVLLGALGVRAASRATPESLLGRSRHADVTRTALRLGFTSSIYLNRTEPIRRARRRRWQPPGGSPMRAMLGKAVLHEQGTPVLARLLGCAAAVAVSLGAAEHVTTGKDLAPTLAWCLGAAVVLTVVATRFADPVRLDVDRAPLAGSVPLRHLLVARADLTVSAALALVGALAGLLADVALGVVPGARLPGLIVAAAALGVLLAAAGALGALSDDPSPLLPPAAAIGYRTMGFVAVTVACVGAGFALRLAGSPGSPPHPDRLPVATLVVVVVALIAATVAAVRAGMALTRGR